MHTESTSYMSNAWLNDDLAAAPFLLPTQYWPFRLNSRAVFKPERCP